MSKIIEEKGETYAAFNVNELKMLKQAMGFSMLAINGNDAWGPKQFQEARFLQDRIESHWKTLMGVEIAKNYEDPDPVREERRRISQPTANELREATARAAWVTEQYLAMMGHFEETPRPEEDII